MATNNASPPVRLSEADAAVSLLPPSSTINPSTFIAPGYHTRPLLIRQPMGQPCMPRNAMPAQISRGGPALIPVQMVIRALRPVNINPPSNSLEDNKKKLVTLLRTFLLRGPTMPGANLPQMINSTEQYLKGRISTSAYIRMLQTNLKAVKNTLASFLDLYIQAVRKDFQESKISMDEIVPPSLTKSSPPDSANSESTPSQDQRHSTSPMAQATKIKTGSAGTSPAMPVNSLQHQQQQFVFKICPGRVETHKRISPLTVSHNPSQLKSSPLPASEGYDSLPPVVAETSFQQYPDPQTSFAPESPLPQNEEEMVCPPVAVQSQDDYLRQSLINPETFSAFMQKKMPGVTIEAPAFLMICEYLETKVLALLDTARSSAEHIRTNSNFVVVNTANEKTSASNRNDARELAILGKENGVGHHDAAIAGKKRRVETDGGPSAKKAIRAVEQISMKDLMYAFEKDSFKC